MKESIGVVPGLAVILVGDRKDSATYVRNKKKACDSVGIKSFEVCLAEDSSEEEVLKSVSGFNDDPSVHGILVQLPLPSHMDEQNILNAVSIEKDVDGFHPLNIGRLAMRGREPLFVPCTPKGCIELLHRYNIGIKEQKKQKLSEIKSGLDNAEVLIRKMDLEARSLPPSLKSSLLVKLREFKSDLNNFKTEVKRITTGTLNAAARDELLEAGMADTKTASADQRSRLMMSTECLGRT